MRIWNLKENIQETVLTGHSGLITSVSVTNDLKYIISASIDKTLRIWDFHTRIQIGILKTMTSLFTIIIMTDDNKYIVAGLSNSTYSVWKATKIISRYYIDKKVNFLN